MCALAAPALFRPSALRRSRARAATRAIASLGPNEAIEPLPASRRSSHRPRARHPAHRPLAQMPKGWRWTEVEAWRVIDLVATLLSRGFRNPYYRVAKITRADPRTVQRKVHVASHVTIQLHHTQRSVSPCRSSLPGYHVRRPYGAAARHWRRRRSVGPPYQRARGMTSEGVCISLGHCCSWEDVTVEDTPIHPLGI